MLGRLLGSFFETAINDYPHPSAYGYLGGRNIRQNATAHLGRKFLLSTDVANFFPSISRDRIEKLFLDLELTPDVARPLSRFVTIGDVLPLGLPTSPVLSNALFLPADVDLQEMADRVGATYTRYSDDLSFSSDDDLPFLEDVAAVLSRNGFAIAADKSKLSTRGQAHYVTGLSITDPFGPHVPREAKRRLRAELYYAKKFGLSSHLQRLGAATPKAHQQNVNRLDGTVKFVAYHEPRLSARLKTHWADILIAAKAQPSYEPRRHNAPPFCICIDEAEFRSQEGALLALGLCVTQRQDDLLRAAAEVLDQWNSDLWSAGDRVAILNRGLHFNEAHEDLRIAFVRRMQSLPFEGYVSFGRLANTTDYEETYLRLFRSVIKRRLMAAESKLATFFIEENSKVAQVRIRELIQNTYDDLKTSNNRRPAGIAIHIRPKPDLGISYPDFLLGVFGKFLRSADPRPGAPVSRDRLQFERLRDKYRLILDADTGCEYSRRRPIQPWLVAFAQSPS
jgi:hypothetical protein